MIRRILFGSLGVGIGVLSLVLIDVIYRPLLFLLGGLYTFVMLEAFAHEVRNSSRHRIRSRFARRGNAGVRRDAGYSNGTGTSGTEHESRLHDSDPT